MKNIKQNVLLMLCSFVLFSCSKDEQPIPLPAPVAVAPSIVDDWNWVSSGQINNSNEVSQEYIRDNGCPYKEDVFLFNQANTFTTTLYSSACESTFFYQETGGYSLNATRDVLTIGGGSAGSTDWDGTYSIVSLTATTLELKLLPANTQQTLRTNYYKFSRRNL